MNFKLLLSLAVTTGVAFATAISSDTPDSAAPNGAPPNVTTMTFTATRIMNTLISESPFLIESTTHTVWTETVTLSAANATSTAASSTAA